MNDVVSILLNGIENIQEQFIKVEVCLCLWHIKVNSKVSRERERKRVRNHHSHWIETKKMWDFVSQSLSTSKKNQTGKVFLLWSYNHIIKLTLYDAAAYSISELI